MHLPFARLATPLIGALLLVSCGSEPPPKEEKPPAQTFIEGPIKGAAGNILASDPKVRHVRQVKTQGVTIWELAIDDDGTPHFEFADKACTILHENGIGRGNHVRIVNAATLKPKEPVDASLGWVNCDDGMRLYL